MEKEKKGLFGRLMDFWREKISVGEADSIGFWHEKENVEKHFAELGTLASLTQEELKKTFWEETAVDVLKEAMEKGVLEKEKKLLFAEDAEEGKEAPENISEETKKIGEKQRRRLFTTEVFREEKQMETKAEGLGKTFLWEMPAEEREKRSIIPVTAEPVQKEKLVTEEQQEVNLKETVKKEETKAEPAVDVEKLMQEMTKKLWEERESCGRRLR